MDEDKLNKMVDELYLLFRLFRKKFFKHKRRLNKGQMPHSSYHVLKILKKHGELPITKIGKQIHVSKSNMTSLIDKLVEEGLAIRIPDKHDRRVINIAITDKGNDLLRDWRKHADDEIKKSLSSLADEDLERLYQSVENIKDILKKLENN